MPMMIKPHLQALSRIYVLMSLLLFPLIHNCKAQENELDINDDIFTKPDSLSPSLSPDGPLSPTTLQPTSSPSEYANSTLNRLNGHASCRIVRDLYCMWTDEEGVDALSNMNDTEIEKTITQTARELGVWYRPLVQGEIDYWKQNSTSDRQTKGGWAGYSGTTGKTNIEVRALAMGVVIKGISNIDAVLGTFDATLKLYFFNITEGPFSTIREAVDTIYKDDSRTTATKDLDYYRLHDDHLPDAWKKKKTQDGEFVHPDGTCSAAAMSSMKPIPMDNFDIFDVMRLPGLKAESWPQAVANGEGYLSYVDVIGVTLKTRPLNREFYPVQTDLLDIFFEMGASNLITEDQRIVKQLLCLHPSYTGFSNDVYGSDAKAGMGTSNALTMVPYMAYDRVEPWFTPDNDQFYYDEERQRSKFGRGSDLQRMIGLRIIVEHPPGKGWFEVLPILFVSLAEIANFVSSDAKNVGAWSMVQALLGVSMLSVV